MNPHRLGLSDLAGTDEDLADLRRRFTGCITIAAFLTNGESVVVDGVREETISYFSQGGVNYLRVSNGIRFTVIPHVQYWTED